MLMLYISETEFSVGFSHTLGTELHDRAWGMAELYFRSDEDLNYAVESAYSVLNLEQGWAILTTIIEEVHSPTDLTRAYSSFDRLDPNSPESFSLGLRERIPVIETLYANRLYRLRMSAQIGRSEGISAGTATGSGSSRVTFTQAPVPEPGTALLVAFGLAALAHRA